MKPTMILTLATCLLTAGCAAMMTGPTQVPAKNLKVVSDAKKEFLDKVKHLDCVNAGVLDTGCYQMKQAAKDGFEDAFVEAGDGLYVLDTMKLDYLRNLAANGQPAGHPAVNATSR